MDVVAGDAGAGVVDRSGSADTGQALLGRFHVGSRGSRRAQTRVTHIKGLIFLTYKFVPRSSANPHCQHLGVGELQLVVEHARHARNNHARPLAQTPAHPVEILLLMGEEHQTGYRARLAARGGERRIVDHNLQSAVAARPRRRHTHGAHLGGERHRLADPGLADRTQRNRVGDTERIVGQRIAHGQHAERLERAHTSLVRHHRRDRGAHCNAHSHLFSPFAPTAMTKPRSALGDSGASEALARDSRGDASDLTGLQALGAHADADVLAVDRGANRLQVRTEGALIADMRMRHGVTGLRSLAAHCATSCHNGLPYYLLASLCSGTSTRTQLHKYIPYIRQTANAACIIPSHTAIVSRFGHPIAAASHQPQAPRFARGRRRIPTKIRKTCVTTPSCPFSPAAQPFANQPGG